MRFGKGCLVSTMFLALAFSMSAWGTCITNGDFEMGDLTGWTVEGPGSVGVYTYNSSKVALMETGYDPDTGGYITTLSQAFVIPDSPLPTILSFDFLFDTGTPVPLYEGYIDALTVSLETDMGDLIDFLIVYEGMSWNDPLCTLTGPSGSGFRTAALDVSAYGGANATIFFELWDEEDQTDSAAMIDNVSCEPIPEPGTLLLILTGLGGISVLRRAKSRRRRS